MDAALLLQRLGPLLSPAGAAWAGLMRLRESAYVSGLFERVRLSTPVVSVGNVAMGGTGKTPVSLWLCRAALAAGLTPCVLTRGYRASPPSLPWRVGPHDPPGACGDEPLLLKRACPKAEVVVDPVRRRGGLWASEALAPDLFVLDDAFQHLALERDLDLCLLRTDDLGESWGRTFPAGYWREGETALRRAHAFLIKTPDGSLGSLSAQGRGRLASLERPVFAFSLAPQALLPLHGGPPIRDLGQEPYVVACGVAHPGQVAHTAQQLLGYPPEEVLVFADHHAFDEADLRSLRARAGQTGAGHVLVTAKDAVKIDPSLLPDGLVLDVTAAFGETLATQHDFPAFVERRLLSPAQLRAKARPPKE